MEDACDKMVLNFLSQNTTAARDQCQFSLQKLCGVSHIHLVCVPPNGQPAVWIRQQSVSRFSKSFLGGEVQEVILDFMGSFSQASPFLQDPRHVLVL